MKEIVMAIVDVRTLKYNEEVMSSNGLRCYADLK